MLCVVFLKVEYFLIIIVMREFNSVFIVSIMCCNMYCGISLYRLLRWGEKRELCII